MKPIYCKRTSSSLVNLPNVTLPWAYMFRNNNLLVSLVASEPLSVHANWLTNLHSMVAGMWLISLGY